MGRWSAVRATEALTWGAHGLGPLTPGAGCAQASSTVHGRLQQGGACANGRKGRLRGPDTASRGHLPGLRCLA